MEDGPEFEIFELMGMTTVITQVQNIYEVQKIIEDERGLKLAMIGNIGKNLKGTDKVRMTFLPKEAFSDNGMDGVL